MFEGFDERDLETERGTIHARVGGSGPPLLALGYWHWGLLAQPAPLPERLIAGDPDAYFDHHLRSIGLDREPGRYPGAVIAAYRAELRDAGIVEAICEDYRAGASIDRQLDEDDRGRLIDCPVLVLWGTRGALGFFYGEVLDVWRSWASDVRGRGVDATHFLVEDCPEEVARELTAFFGCVPVSVDPGRPGDPEQPRDPGRL